MKNIKLSVLALLLLCFAGCYVQQPVATVAPPPPPPQTYEAPAPAPASYQSFYDELAPYGIWVSDPRYGYVWSPNVEAGFRPYVTDGYWAYSDAGWAWVSYYNWGWAPFHYGRWFEDPYYGWMWIPGHDWAPAWVSWGNYNGYYGWAPLGPGYQAGAGYYPPINSWCFTDARYMGNREWSNHYYVSQGSRISMGNNAYIENVNNITIINNTGNYNSRAYNAGPRKDEIENSTRVPIQTVRITENERPGKSEISNGSLNIYRPRVSGETNTTAKPSRVTPIENVRQRQQVPDRQQERTPDRQQQGNPEMNKEVKPMERPSPQQQQQLAPKQENNQALPRTRENQPAPIQQQQQQQAPRQGNQVQQNNRGNQVPNQQPQQQGKNPNKRANKQAKQPAKNTPDKSGEKIAPEKR